MTSMDIQEILKHLPHRYPFLLVDRVLSVEAKKNIVALKNVSINEPFFPGHFPNYAVMPGVLIVEALAQAAAILSFVSAERTPNENTVIYLVGVDNARFKRPVTPGDQLWLHVQMLAAKRGLLKYAAQAKVDEQVVAECQILCTERTVA
jgi:3-hydroxyacyl-[acyl-carrier-protein] dehydratase